MTYHYTTVNDEILDREFFTIQEALAQVHLIGFTHIAPERLSEGQIYLAPGAPGWDPGSGRGLYICLDGLYKRLDVTGNTLLGTYDQVTDTPTLNCSPNPQNVLSGDYYLCITTGACTSSCANINGVVLGPGDQIVWSGTAWEAVPVSQSYLSSTVADTALGHITLNAGGSSLVAPTIATHLARKTETDAAIAHSDAADILQDALINDLTNELEILSGASIALSLEKQVISLDISGDPVYAEVEALGGGDIHYYFDDGVVAKLNCTTGPGTGGKARVALVPGLNANSPIVNYLYVTHVGDVATLQITETTYPTEAFAWVGKVNIPDLATLASTGPYLLQRFTEAFTHGGRGALSYEREKLRVLGAVYSTGGAHSVLIDDTQTPDSVHLHVAAAVVYQLHRQNFPAFSVGPYHNGNGQNIYEQFANINEVIEDADGNSLNNRYFNLVFWGSVNQDIETCNLYCNRPYGSYSGVTNAIADSDATADLSVPPDMRTVSFLICRAVFSYRSASGGTWSLHGLYSLLGTMPGIRTGGSGAAVSNEFADIFFRITDDDDETSKIAFEAGQITPANVRTITMPDHDVDLGALLTKLDAFNNLVWTGYMQLSCPDDSAFADIDITYQKIDILTVESITPERFVTDAPNSRFQFLHDGVYRFTFGGAIEHNEVNQGREFFIQFYDATDAVVIGIPYPIGTGRNIGISNISINALLEITEAMKGHWIEIYIGGGDTYTAVSFVSLDVAINNIGEWRDPLPF